MRGNRRGIQGPVRVSSAGGHWGLLGGLSLVLTVAVEVRVQSQIMGEPVCVTRPRGKVSSLGQSGGATR